MVFLIGQSKPVKALFLTLTQTLTLTLLQALIAVVFLIGQSKPVKALFFNFLETVENASWGAPLMILCLLVMVPAMIPTTPFNVAAGYLFGWAGS